MTGQVSTSAAVDGAKLPARARVVVDGKFFRLDGCRFQVKGITYGPFKPNEHGSTFAPPAETARDFKQIRDLGASVLRIYYAPPRWFLDLAEEHGLKVLVDVPWSKHLCFMDSAKSQAEAREVVRQAVHSVAGHPAVLAWSVVNEIPPDIVRWSGARRVEAFIDELVDVAKSADPQCLCTFTNFPPTEFLRPLSIDWVCFNVYLHQRGAFEAYLARLQTLADIKPLVLGEFGIDSIREGEARKCEILAWQIESAARAGLAGTVIFSYTDDWFRGGKQIEDWAFGLTTRDRRPKTSFAVVQRQFRQAPYFSLPRAPKVSVVVATYNGSRTLKTCLESLGRLNYPDYEVIVVDDGSADAVPQIAAQFPSVRYIRQANCGLSVARNTGIAVARGEIVAFTDDDCRADADWLYHLVGDLMSHDWAGAGGHNLLPPEDSPVAAAVLVSPGGPAHVMLDDRVAEHVPGCNMAFWKWALDEIGGFDPIFRKAGDDVDVCWRLQQHGYKIGFSPAGFVWHYRRSTIRAYLRQQAGYGEAEALLVRKHPEYFNWQGGGLWRGRIYAASKSSVVMQRPVIYHGVFASGFFQTLYAPPPAFGLMFLTSLEYHGTVTLPLFILSPLFGPLLTVAVTSGLMSLGICMVAAAQADLPARQRRWWSRLLVAALFFLQPIRRGWARYRWRLNVSSKPKPAELSAHAAERAEPAEELAFWTDDARIDRLEFLGRLLAQFQRHQWRAKPDNGWGDYDLEIVGSPLNRVRLVTACEELGQGRRILKLRLRTRWSLLARGLWISLLGAALLVIGLLAPRQPWIWMLLLLLPCLNGFFDYQQHRLICAIADLLNAVATENHFVRLDAGKQSPPTPAATSAV